MGSSGNPEGDGNENVKKQTDKQKKNNRFNQQNNNPAREAHCLVHFLTITAKFRQFHVL